MPPKLRIKEIKTKQATKEKTSNFFVTINTNQRVQTPSEAIKIRDALRKTVHQFAVEKKMKRMTEILIPGDDWDKNVLDLSAEFGVEVGHHKFGRRVHVHVQITILHTTKLRLNLPEVRHLMNSKFAKEFGEDIKLYINVKAFGEMKTNVRNYIAKHAGDDAWVRELEILQEEDDF